jgi:hypothetical protein
MRPSLGNCQDMFITHKVSPFIEKPLVIIAMSGSICFVLMIANASNAATQELVAKPVPKAGTCPSGYTISGSYCNPGRDARFAVQKIGTCPSGYSTSGGYCLAGRKAISKAGACPSGWSVSGDYCLSNR